MLYSFADWKNFTKKLKININISYRVSHYSFITRNNLIFVSIFFNFLIDASINILFYIKNVNRSPSILKR